MKKILIIEDNNDVRENLVEILQLSSYETIEAENGKIGVEKAKRDKPDLIICDVMMPELDGFGVLKILNKDPKLMHIPFLFLTAKAEKTDFRKGMGLGADDYITKPFDDVELLESIEIRLKKSENLQTIDNTDAGLRQFFNAAKAERELEKLSEAREIRKYQKKDEIYSPGKYANWLLFIISGQVKTFQVNDFGKELTTKIYGPGEFLGFLPLIQSKQYESYAVATEETNVRLIPAEDFKLLLFNNRDFSAKFIQMLANHVEETESHLIEFAYSTVRKKLANALLILAEKSRGSIFAASRDDLASLTGAAKETVTRTLTDFKEEQLVNIKDGMIEITEKKKLEDMPQ